MDTFDFLASGEDVSTTSAAVAQHWSDFYRERSSFDQTVRRLKRQVGGLAGVARQDAVTDALPHLIADAHSFERRFDFWEGRVAHLS